MHIASGNRPHHPPDATTRDSGITTWPEVGGEVSDHLLDGVAVGRQVAVVVADRVEAQLDLFRVDLARRVLVG